jgi:hypothetical protein
VRRRLCYTFAIAPLVGLAHAQLPTPVAKYPKPRLASVASGEV